MMIEENEETDTTTSQFLASIKINNTTAEKKLIEAGYEWFSDIIEGPPRPEDLDIYGFNNAQRNKILTTLSQTPPTPERSWHIDPTIKNSTKLHGKPYVLIPATQKDFKKVLGFYAHHPVDGYEIGKVEVIYNPAFNRKFTLHMVTLQERDNNLAFVPNWSQMSYPNHRKDLMVLFNDVTQPHCDPDYPALKLLPAWHGTKKGILDSIFRTGYSNLSTTDDGYFGKGLYTTYEAEYAYRVYSKPHNDSALILNWVACFSALPVVYEDMTKLCSKSNYGNYDAHWVPVVPKDPHDPNECIYFPCQEGQRHQYTELVVFESSACLPRYVVTLQKALLKSPVLSHLAPSEYNPKPPFSTQPIPVPGEVAYQEGLQCFSHAQYQKALTYFKQAANDQYPAAYMWLGLLYQHNGLVGPKNPVESEKWCDKVRKEISWFKIQAEMGKADAQFNLGRCYQFGIGVAKDAKEAVHYYQLAAEQENANAQFNLGWCYDKGEGVTQDFIQMVHYYQLAAKQGHAVAQDTLGCYYKSGKWVTKDLQQAVHYFKLAAEQGNANAQFNLGLCYDNGEGVTKNLMQAVHYYQLAAKQGDSNAQNNLAALLKANPYLNQ